ncbi:abnormal cell migration protein 13-like [Pecten maximus]|uniref:abnormal cell migration protein 13-like n=1 Tax=Pecten maximus TaxID=6579 RepID=UPI001458E084|nr:abnormal cell migration protein 13-like [Pecten maximus]
MFTDYMDQHCSETLNMTRLGIESAKLKLTRWHKYKSNMRCYLTIEAPLNKFIMITFRDIDIKTGVFGRCEGDRLQIYDGRDSSANMVGGLTYKLCGERRPRGAFYTTQRYMTFLFESDSFFTDDGFSLIFTSFHTGTCLSSETACKRGQCISKSLECDGYNQCGDSTDECKMSGGPIAGIIVAVIVVVAVISVVFVCWRRRRASHGAVIKYNSPNEQATVIPPPSSYPAQPAPVPAPQPYPPAPYQQPPPQGYPQPPPPQGYPQPPPQGYPQPPPQGYPPASQPYPTGPQAYPPPQQAYQGMPPSYNDATQNPYPYGAPMGQSPYPPEPK